MVSDKDGFCDVSKSTTHAQSHRSERHYIPFCCLLVFSSLVSTITSVNTQPSSTLHHLIEFLTPFEFWAALGLLSLLRVREKVGSRDLNLFSGRRSVC